MQKPFHSEIWLLKNSWWI